MIQNHRKRLGQFFTPPEVAQTLVRWLHLAPSETLLDPSCGDGQFLRCHKRSVGIEIDPANAAIARQCAPSALVHGGDFFTWAGATKERFKAIAGNPPFIRYQTFTGETRERALAAARVQGADFSALTSSWAPFLIVASGLLHSGGRMAFVIPAEIGHATYARPLLRALCQAFGRVHVIAYRGKIFPQLSEDCWLLYCSDYGSSTRDVALTTLDRFAPSVTVPAPTQMVHLDEWEELGARLRPFLLPSDALSLYRVLTSSPDVKRLGEFASASVGYVTGGNDFFHLRPSEVERLKMPRSLFKVAVRKSEQLPDEVVDRAVVDRWLREDQPVLLLDLNSTQDLPHSVTDYLNGETGRVVRTGYKCRNRSPWYVVPDVHAPDAFLSVMSGTKPSLVRNAADCVCTNTLHAVRFKKKVDPGKVQEGWKSPLSQLGAEIEGHPLGGGMLKLEPREAARVPIPLRSLKLSKRDSEAVAEAVGIMRHWRHHA